MRKRIVPCFLLAAMLALSMPAMGQFYITPHLQNITPDGVTIIWETPDASIGAVEFSHDGEPATVATDKAAAKIHRVRIMGLSADTTYDYSVTGGTETFSSQFRTAPGSADHETVWVLVGDSRRWDDTWEKTGMKEHMLQWNPEFLLNVGDLVVRGHEYELWPEHFKRFSDINHRLQMLTARGNHEGSMIVETERDWFAKYHDLPGAGEPYSTFDWGNTHFILLSYEQIVGALQEDTVEWLDKHLATVDSQYIVVAQHFPVFCTGYYSPTESRKEPGVYTQPLWEVFDKYGVDLHVSGHTHIYERLWPIRDSRRNDADGVQYIVNGGDINANFPDWFSAVTDNRETMAKPTYTVFHSKSDRMTARTFAYSPVEEKIIEIDYVVRWEDESVPKAVLESLTDLEGKKLAAALEELGAMLYHPAGETLLEYLDTGDLQTRRAAAHGLSALGSSDLASQLIPRLDDADLEVRRSIARALEAAMPKMVLGFGKDLTAPLHKYVLDANEDPQVRTALMGALLLHGAPEKAAEVALAVLAADAPAPVRQRAAYALGVVAANPEISGIARAVEREEDPYVLLRLGYILNNLTGNYQALDGNGAFAISEPGKRRQFIDAWLGRG